MAGAVRPALVEAEGDAENQVEVPDMPIIGLDDEVEYSGLGLKLTDIPSKIRGAAQKKVEATLWDMFIASIKRKLGLK